MNLQELNKKPDFALLCLLNSKDEPTKEFALNDLINIYKPLIFEIAKFNNNTSMKSIFNGLIVLARIINSYNLESFNSLESYIKKKLRLVLNHFKTENYYENINNKFEERLKEEVQLIKAIYPSVLNSEIAKILQIPFEPGQNILSIGLKYGFMPISKQITIVQWLVIYKLNYSPFSDRFSSLNDNLGFSISYLKEIEWWSKYEIFQIINNV